MNRKFSSPKSKIKPKFLITTGLGIVIIAGLISNYKSNFTPSKSTDYSSEKELKSSDNKPQKFTVNPNRDTVLVFESGSIIKITKNSFEDKNGLAITENITLSYREFHSVGETILAGIPMDYDSSGTKYHFESAGMFEILAEVKNEPIHLKKQAAIEVELVTGNSDQTKFNQYYLENNDSKWKFIDKDIVSFFTPADSLNKEVVNLTDSKYIQPKLINAKNKQFVIEVQKDKYPELEVFKKIVFEVSPENKNFDINKTKNKWMDVELKRIDQTINYEITFLGANEKYKVIAYPVIDTSDYASALASFNKLNETYQNKLIQKNKKEVKSIEKLQSQENFYTKARDNYRDYLKKYEGIFSDSMALINMQQRRYDKVNDVVLRTFQVRKFGIYNSDCPSNLPQGMIVSASFVDEKGNILNPSNIFLIENGKNAVYTLYDKSKISFNPNSENKFIILTNGVLSLVYNDEFERIKKEDKTVVFKVKTVKKEVYTAADINLMI